MEIAPAIEFELRLRLEMQNVDQRWKKKSCNNMTLVITLGLNILYNEQKAIRGFMWLGSVALLSPALNDSFLDIVDHEMGFQFSGQPS